MVARNPVHADRKRAQIRAGARQAFTAYGFSGCSTDQVATAAGVSKQTLYSYYRSKDDLLVDVFSTLLDELADPRDVWQRPVTTRDELREVLQTIALLIPAVAMQESYLSLVRVVINELPSMPELGDLWRTSVPSEGMKRIRAVLARAQDGGVVRGDVDLDLATRMFLGPILTYVVLDGLARPGKVVRPGRARLEDMTEMYLRAIT